MTIRGVAPGDPVVVALVNEGRSADGPGAIQNRVSATLPAGVSLITMLIAEGGGDWATRLVLLEPGTNTSVVTHGLVSYSLTPR